MQKQILSILIGLYAVLPLTGMAMPEPVAASTWVKLDANDLTTKPYQVYATAATLIDNGTACAEGQIETCQLIKLGATPITNNGKIHVKMYHYDSVKAVSCQASFDEIPFSLQNNTITTPSSSYTTKWASFGADSSECPASTVTLTVSSANDFTGYLFKVVETK